MRAPTRTLLTLALVAGLLGTARAQHGQGHDMPGHAAHGQPGAVDGSDSPATRSFREVDARMHRDMAIRYTNDVDLDFVRGMIPHHEGAIAMARVALEHSKDPEIRRLAEDIIAAQDKEIAQMQAFLKQRGAQPARP